MRPTIRRLPAAALIAVFFIVGGIRAAAQSATEPPDGRHETRARRPVSLVLSANARWLYVANQRAGSVAVIDLDADCVVNEADVGHTLSDLAGTPDGRWLLATDQAAHQLIVMRCDGAAVEPVRRLPVERFPVRVIISPDGTTCSIASLWSRAVTLVDLKFLQSDDDQALPENAIRGRIALPFAPRELLYVRDGNVVLAADSFGGSLAVIDAERVDFSAVRSLPAHNIRGLASDRSGSQLFVSHQLLNSLAETTHNDVHWGVLLTNNLRRLRLESVVSPDAPLLEGSQMHFLGDPGNATGDPAGVAVTGRGTVAVALAGVDQVAIGDHLSASFHRVPVGRRPTRVILSGDERRAYVANTLSDSVSVIDLESIAVEREISLGPQPEPTLVDRGERLFNDARLSLDGWYSCHSCHTDGHTNGLLADNLGDGNFGAPKRVLSLLGAGDTGPWAWNGEKTVLADQIRVSIRSTMQGPEPSDDQVAALEAYLRILKPAPARTQAAGHDAAIARGGELFGRLGCAGCHRPPRFTTAGVYDVGLDDGHGLSQYNPPSLRGVSQGGPYFHDNRAPTVEEVFTRYRHGLREPIRDGELRDLLAFLASL